MLEELMSRDGGIYFISVSLEIECRAPKSDCHIRIVDNAMCGHCFRTAGVHDDLLLNSHGAFFVCAGKRHMLAPGA